MKRLAVLGASGHGKVAADIAEILGWRDICFFDDTWPEKRNNSRWNVVGNSETLCRSLDQYDGLFVAIGNNRIRHQKIEFFKKQDIEIVSLIHPTAAISSYTAMGIGGVVMAGAVVNVDTRIGEGAIINTGSSVDHDCHLEDCVHVSPGAHLAGGVKVGSRSWIGIGATVRQSVSIGIDVMVGAGAAVVRDLPDGITVIGVPARQVS